MPRVKIVYEPDDSCGRVVHDPFPNGGPGRQNFLNGRVIRVPRIKNSDYLPKEDPRKSKMRMETDAETSKGLTPKGYQKKNLIDEISTEQFEKLTKKLRETKTLWEDPDFPANANSIGNINLPFSIEWKRPKQIYDKPEFVIGGVDRFDVDQGQLGDCWLLAVVSSISTYEPLFNQICPPGQKIQSPDYCGLFRFRFWRFGKWVEVLVDDRLPVVLGTKNLVFMNSPQNGEIWSALMEKAYAKIYGNYANIVGGMQSEAMEDLTGGMCETFNLKSPPDNFLQHLIRCSKKCCLMGCCVMSKVMEGRLDNGLVTSHAYSVTKIDSINFQGKEKWLVRCRNPWGNNVEWKGAFGDQSPEWKIVDEATKKRLGLKLSNDGEFWITFEDFIREFSNLEVCYLGMEALDDSDRFNSKRRMDEVVFSGSWSSNINAGGCSNYPNTFWTNPQFIISIKDPDPNDNDNSCTCMIGLMQLDSRQKGKPFDSIGFVIYELDNTRSLKDRKFFATHNMVGRSEFSNMREVVLRIKLPPGDYIIVPSTFEPNNDGKFILRVISEVAIKEEESDVKNDFLGVSKELVLEMQAVHDKNHEDDIVIKQFHELSDEHRDLKPSDLRKILNKSSFSKVPGFKDFNLEICRSFIACIDDDHSGALELEEFKILWECLETWKFIFTKFDLDKSGSFSTVEFRTALMNTVNRYTEHETGLVSLEDWLLCCARLKNAMENLQAQPKNLDGEALLSSDDFMRLSVYV